MASGKQTFESNPELSIIIISYNTKQITKDCIESIYSSKPNVSFEIIVIDNTSADGSVEMLKNLQKDNDNLILVENKENTGFAKANNQGAKIARGNYILLLNSDTIILDDALSALMTFYKENEDHIHFLGPKLLNADKSPQASCGPFYTLPVIFAALFLRGDYWGLTRYSPDAVKAVDWISGACILTKKEYFDQIQGFDEQIFMYMDEIDLLYRAKKENMRVFFYPQSQIVHLGSASSNGKSFPVQQVYKGFLYFYKKHHAIWQLNMLQYILKIKALIAITIGCATGNQYLINTYEKAYKIATMD